MLSTAADLLAAAVPDRGKFTPSASGAEKSDHAGGDDDDRERHVEEEDRDEGDGGETRS